MSPGAKEKGKGVLVWDFKGQEGESHRERKDGPSVTMGHKEVFDQMGLARFLSVYYILVHIKLYLSMMISPFLEQVFYLNSFR